MGLQNISLNFAIVLTGLSAGLFYAWSVSVIPGTQKIEDLNYLRTMQSINREIFNPSFFLVFFGSLITLASSTFLTYPVSSKGFWVILTATLAYLIGTFGVTALGNVPLNDELDVLQLEELSTQKIAEFRQYYESQWNKLHSIRMVFAVLSFGLALLTLSIQFKN